MGSIIGSAGSPIMGPRLSLLITASTWLFASFALMDGADRVDYSGYQLYRITPASKDHLQRLKEWVEDTEARHEFPKLVDVWSEPTRLQPHMDLLVSPRLATNFSLLLSSNGIRLAGLELLSNNIQREINRERRRRRRRRHSDPRPDPRVYESRLRSSADFDLNRFQRYAPIVDYLRLVAKENPEVVELVEFGKSFEGRDLVGVRVGIGGGGAPKPSIFIDAGMHAREWISTAAALYLIDRFHPLLSKFDFIVLPVVNPDGYEHSHTRDRFWRKTRSRRENAPKSQSDWCVGADANRNWGYRWGEVGSNNQPCSIVYAGDAAFSEPEVAAMRDYLTMKVKDLKVYISLHSYGQLFLSPWGYKAERPNNYIDQSVAALRALSAIKNATGAEYRSGTIAEIMYPASGTSIDYLQSRGVPYIYAVELRPENSMEVLHGFIIPPDLIEPTGRELLAAVKAIAEYVVETRRL